MNATEYNFLMVLRDQKGKTSHWAYNQTLKSKYAQNKAQQSTKLSNVIL